MLVAGDKPQERSLGFLNFSVPVLRERPLYNCVPGFVGRDGGDCFMRPVIIYGLVDPRTSYLRYIGKTVGTAEGRVRGHMKSTNYCGRWLRSLASQGLYPDIIILEVSDEESWIEAEIFWIAYFKSLGCNLTNRTIGGDGVSGWKHTEEFKKKVGLFFRGRPGRPLSEATKKLISQRMTGRKLREDVSERLHIAAGNARRGTTNSPEHRRKISLARKGQPAHNKGKVSPRRGIPTGRKNTPEHQRKLADAARAAQLGVPKTEAHREAIRRGWARRLGKLS